MGILAKASRIWANRHSFRALEKAIAGKPHPAIDGFTPEQRFFINSARIWGGDLPPEFERKVATDPHPLGRFRVVPRLPSGCVCENV